MVTRLASGAALALGALLLAACDDETAEPVPVGPTGPPALAFIEPSGDDPQPICTSVGTDPDARIPLLVETTELVLRPPQACGAYVQCGHLALYVDGVPNNVSAVPTIELLLRKLGDRYHDGSIDAATGEPDVLAVRVEVQDDEGFVLLDHDEMELADEIEIVTLDRPCPDAPRQPPPESGSP